jgi:colicin import membrane protein
MLKNFNLFRWIFSLLFMSFDDPPGGGGDPAANKAKAEEEEKKKQQEELNKQFADRAARATEAERKRILEELGVKDPEEAKALLKIAREADEKTKSETEKLAAKAKAAEEAKERAETEAKAKLDEANKKLLDSEIKISARTAVTDKAGKVTRAAFRKEAMGDVLLLIDRKEIEEKDGEFKGVEKALEALAKAKPYLLEEKQEPRRGTPPERPGGGGGRNSDGERTPIISSL